MNTLAKENMNIAVNSLKKISETDLADLCNITEPVSYTHLTLPTIYSV